MLLKTERKTMKKIISLFMVLTMVLSLAACSTNQSPSESTPEESSSQTNESTPTPSNTNGKNLVVYFSMPDNVDDSTVVIDGETLGNTQYMAFFLRRKEPKAPKARCRISALWL
jgi:predicted small lipoprotein YifL